MFLKVALIGVLRTDYREAGIQVRKKVAGTRRLAAARCW
jgi:hypothetical protein